MSCPPADLCKPKNPFDAAKLAINNDAISDLKQAVSMIDDAPLLSKLLALVLNKQDDEKCAILLELLLSNGADPNMVVDIDKYPIHIIMERGFVQSLRILLNSIKNVKLNVKTSVLNTGLHCAIRGLNDEKYRDETRGTECIQLVLDQDKSFINSKNNADLTAVQLALKYKFWKILKCLIANKESLDQESADKISNENSSDNDLMQIKQMIENIEIKNEIEKDLRNDFKIALRKDDTSEIEKMLDEICKDSQDINESGQKNTYLQLAVKNNCKFAVERLLKSGANVNLKTPKCISTPAMIAVEQENPEILQLLIDDNNCDLSISNNTSHNRTVLHIAAIENTNSQCLDILIKNAEKCNLNINSQDYAGYTALHIAAKNNKYHMVESLLENNANIFLTDYEDIPAFFEIAPKYINDLLDSKIIPENSVINKNYNLNFNYDFLSQGIQSENIKNSMNSKINPSEFEMTPLKCDVEKNKVTSSQTFNSHIAEPEMSPLEMLADSPNHRFLLKHPIIRAFLLLKWNRVSWFFYTNCFFYFLFTVCLSFFVSSTLAQTNCTNSGGNNAEDELIPTNDFTNNKTWGFWKISTAIFLFILIIRELFQVIMSFCNYIKQVENWLEVAMILLTFILIINGSNDIRFWQSIAAFAILFTYIELVLMFGRHPLFSTYIKMFFTVFKSFIQLLMWYSLFIFGFSFSFYILLKSCKTDDWFFYYSTSLFKTIIMLTGEFESGEIEFNSVAITSHILFILFIFFMSIVLLNLLTGLAVGDIQTIRNEAELYSCIAQVQNITQIEKVLIGGKLKDCVPWILSKCIILMPILKNSDYKLKIKLGGGKNELEPKEIYGCCNGCIACSSLWRCVGVKRKTCKMCFLVNTVVSEAREIVEHKENYEDGTDSKKQLLERMEMLEKTLLKALNK